MTEGETQTDTQSERERTRTDSFYINSEIWRDTTENERKSSKCINEK